MYCSQFGTLINILDKKVVLLLADPIYNLKNLNFNLRVIQFGTSRGNRVENLWNGPREGQ